MMNIFWYEFSKTAAKKQVWMFFLALLFAGLLFTGRQVQSAAWDMDGISQQEYDDYREGLIQNARQVTGISLFADKTTFVYRNAGCIIGAYVSCADIEIRQQSPAGVQLLCDTFYTDILTVLWILALLYWIVLEERKNGQFSLQRTTRNGRRYLGNVKLALLLMMSVMGLSVLMLERLVMAAGIYGLGDVSRSIQSVFPASVSHLNILQMLVLSFCIKCLGCMVLAVLLYLAAQLFLNNRVLEIVWLAVLLGSLLAYKFIAENSWLAFAKEANLWSFLNASRLFTRYKNLNIFQHPVSYRLVFTVVTGIIFAVGTVPALLLYGRKNIIMLQRQKRFFRPSVSHTGIRRHELYKLMTMGGWWLVFVMLLAGLYVTKEEYRLYSSEDEYYYWDYCRRLEGSWGDEQEAYLASEQERFSDMLEMMAQGGMASVAAGTQYTVYQSYQKVCMQAEVLRNIPDGQLLYDKGYNYLLPQTNIWGYMCKGILLLILLLFSMGTVWEMEYRYDQMKLITATQAGKKRVRKVKHGACLAMGMFLYLVLMAEMYIRVGMVYGYKGLTAPAACLLALSWVPSGISVIAYLFLQNLVLLLVTELVAMVIVKAFGYFFR